jgi:hypothetical protein
MNDFEGLIKALHGMIDKVQELTLVVAKHSEVQRQILEQISKQSDAITRHEILLEKCKNCTYNPQTSTAQRPTKALEKK